jgi:CubicO group peptidase (beta-lactamase class C family)
MLTTLIKRRIERAMAEKAFPGCVIGIVRTNGERTVLPFGAFTYDPGATRMKEESLFDVASITKAIPTSCLALALIDKGELALDDRLIEYVPEFSIPNREKALIRHLLTQTLNFGFRLSEYKDRSPEGLLEVIYSTELSDPPGTTFYYSNATSILLGLAIERCTGKCLASLADDFYFGPLAMTRTTFFPESLLMEEIVPTEFDAWRGRLIRGEVHDESAFTLRKKMIAGSAGLFSTVPDILNFLEMLLRGGEMKGRRFFSSSIMEAIQTNQVTLPGVCAGLGWELCQSRYMGNHRTPRTFGKTGFTGCVCMADLEKRVGFTLLSNYTFPKRKPDTASINAVRSDCADIIFSSSPSS